MVFKNLFYYLDVQLEFEDESLVTKEEFKDSVFEAVNTVFGESGSCVPIDLLKYYSEGSHGIIRCPLNFYYKLRAALTFYGDYKGRICCFTTLKVSPELISLAFNSRNYNHSTLIPTTC